ncbi:hypothetical protein Hypma_006184 [Hypsizygus marmoreus]|uniref:Uncharacterized protein n=1 Tax=Hypsizygus marmoreus TaxID=39966 RepID=A0A369JWU2_HYPMA|nr:hypothetical protein Hypma_006184 [Hypsizygus marmoreus]
MTMSLVVPEKSDPRSPLIAASNVTRRDSDEMLRDGPGKRARDSHEQMVLTTLAARPYRISVPNPCEVDRAPCVDEP